MTLLPRRNGSPSKDWELRTGRRRSREPESESDDERSKNGRRPFRAPESAEKGPSEVEHLEIRDPTPSVPPSAEASPDAPASPTGATSAIPSATPAPVGPATVVPASVVPIPAAVLLALQQIVEVLPGLLVHPEWVGLRCLDFRSSTAQALNPGTLSDLPNLHEVTLMKSLCVIGDGVLCRTALKHLDLSNCINLTSIGNCFVNNTPLEVFIAPPNLHRLGSGAFYCTALVELNLGSTRLQYIEPGFLNKTVYLQSLILPMCLEVISDFFCNDTSLRCLDLRHCGVQEIGNFFLCDNDVEELLLPRTLMEIGDCALQRTRLDSLNLRQTCVERIGTAFLDLSQVRYISLPRTFQEIGEGFPFGAYHLTVSNDGLMSLLAKVLPPLVEYRTLREALDSYSDN